jgi:hypothetical protein
MKWLAEAMRGGAYASVITITVMFVIVPETLGSLLERVDQGRWGNLEQCESVYEGINL